MNPTPRPNRLPDITRAEPDLVLDGRALYFVWNSPRAHTVRKENGMLTGRIVGPSIPKGMLIYHPSAEDGTVCVSWLPWARDPDDPGETWTLLSLHPLSLAETFLCGRCGAPGGVRDGRWMVALGPAA